MGPLVPDTTLFRSEPLQARHRSGRRSEVILAPVGVREFVPRPFVEYAPYAHLPFAGFLVTDHRPRPPHILGLLGAVGRVPLRLDVVIVGFLHLVRGHEELARHPIGADESLQAAALRVDADRVRAREIPNRPPWENIGRTSCRERVTLYGTDSIG